MMTELSDVYKSAAKDAIKELFTEGKISREQLGELLGGDEKK